MNQTPGMPSVNTSSVIATGVSIEKLVAAIDTPASHQGSDRPATKKLSTEPPARRATTSPTPKIAAR